MDLEFKVYELKEDSRSYKRLLNFDPTNEFIVVGEEVIKDKSYYKAHQVGDRGLCFIADFKIDEMTLSIPKDDLTFKKYDMGYETQVFDIPKERLTVDAIDSIKRLNS